MEDINNLMITHQDMDSLLEKTVKLIARQLTVEVCSIFLYDEDSGKLFLKANVGLNSDAVTQGISLLPGEGIVGLAFQENQVIHEREASKNRFFKFFPELGEEKYPSFLAIPIVFKRYRLGVLALQTSKDKNIREMEVKLLKSLSTQLGILLKNNEFYHKIQGFSRTEARPEVPRSSNRRIRGKGVSSGIAIGRAYFLQSASRIDEISINRISNDDAGKEETAFQGALKNSLAEMESWTQNMALSMKEIKNILEGQMMLLKDPGLQKKIIGYIRKGYTLESALKLVYEEYQAIFENMEDIYFQERLLDLKDVLCRVLSFSFSKDHHELFKDSIIVVNEMFPSYFLQTDITKIRGIITRKPTLTSHSVILAKAFQIPMITGVTEALSQIQEGERLIIDAEKDEVLLCPGSEVVKEYENSLKALSRMTQIKTRGRPVTRDGYEIRLSANLGLIHEIPPLMKIDFHDIGLYRTEFLFLLQKDFPSVEEQLETYSLILKKLKGKPVTFRTLDLGGDKQLSYFKLPQEENPLLGFRSIRIFKKHPQILKDQLKALLQAAHSHDCRIMFPLVNHYEEFMFCSSLVKEAEKELRREGRPYRVPPLGIMVETPASVFNLAHFAGRVDFISVGTNDLLQYLMAVDRNNLYTEDAYNLFDPAFLKILFYIADECKRLGIESSVCGEAAGNPIFLPAMLGAGFDKLSMVPSSIPQIHQLTQKLNLDELKVLARKLLEKNKAMDIEMELKRFQKRLE